MFARCLATIFLMSACLPDTDCARILAVIPIPSFSHQVFYRPLWRELALRGHQVVLLTTDPMHNNTLTTLKEIDLHGAYKLSRMLEIVEEFKHNPYRIMKETANMLHQMIRYELELPEVRRLIEDENEHFDLLLVEDLMPDMLAFSHRFRCPFIGVVSLDAHTTVHEAMGNPTHPVLYPDFQLPFIAPLSLAERAVAVAFHLLTAWFGHWYVRPRSNENVLRYFGEGYPDIVDIQSNISLLFANTNPAFTAVRPVGPDTVAIGGGTHIDPLKPLPRDIQSFLDGAKDGAIYFSLGSNVKSKHITEDLKKMLRSAIEELPYKVLWKFEENVKDIPKNVKIVKWCPQQDVLRHPNVKLFITQGGLQSTEESIMSNVPLIGIPFFMDQLGNVKKIKQTGIGLALDKDTVTKEVLVDAINEVINNPKYKAKTVELSQIALDQPMTGIEKAIWWTEYVLRHKGAPYLKAKSIPTYQFFLLDVILIFIAIFVIIIFFIYAFIKLILGLLFKSRKLKRQ